MKTIWIVANASLIYWYVKRRDIFPKFFTSYVISIIIGNLLLLSAYNMAGLESLRPGFKRESYMAIGKIIVYGAIWIPYLSYSQKVKQTFVHAYDNE